MLSKYKNNELILSAYMALLCIFSNKSKKMIIYCNKVESAKLVQEIIGEFLRTFIHDKTLFNKNNIEREIGNYELNGSDSIETRNEILDKFTLFSFALSSIIIHSFLLFCSIIISGSTH